MGRLEHSRFDLADEGELAKTLGSVAKLPGIKSQLSPLKN